MKHHVAVAPFPHSGLTNQRLTDVSVDLNALLRLTCGCSRRPNQDGGNPKEKQDKRSSKAGDLCIDCGAGGQRPLVEALI